MKQLYEYLTTKIDVQNNVKFDIDINDKFDYVVSVLNKFEFKNLGKTTLNKIEKLQNFFDTKDKKCFVCKEMNNPDWKTILVCNNSKDMPYVSYVELLFIEDEFCRCSEIRYDGQQRKIEDTKI